MATLVKQKISETGLNPSLGAAAAGGDAYPNDDRTFLVVDNAGVSSINVTITAQRTVAKFEGYGDLPVSNIVVAVPNGEQRYIKAPKIAYNDGNGRAVVSYSAVTSVTVAAVEMPSG